MIRRPPRSTLSSSSAASDVYKRQIFVLCLIKIKKTFWKDRCICPVEGADIESYKRKSKGLNPLETPLTSPLNSFPPNERLNHCFQSDESLVICGQDIILDILTRYLEKQFPQGHFLRRYIWKHRRSHGPLSRPCERCYCTLMG